MNQEQQIAKMIVRILDDNKESLAPEVKDRLVAARRRAVAAAVESHASVHAGWTLIALRQRTRSAAILLGAVLLTFIVTQQLTGYVHGEHGDAFLLASELPPEAYLDQGFYSWLEQQ